MQYETNTDILNKIKQTQLEILREFDRVCKKHNISYLLYAGTLLGAIRHKGFIPWDDDVDVCMLRRDYERFIRMANQSLPSHLNVRHLKIEKDYMFEFAKVDDSNTTLIEYTRRHYGNYGGIYVDVFPLDNAPDSVIRRKINFRIIYTSRKLLNFHFETLDFSEKNKNTNKASH